MDGLKLNTENGEQENGVEKFIPVDRISDIPLNLGDIWLTVELPDENMVFLAYSSNDSIDFRLLRDDAFREYLLENTIAYCKCNKPDPYYKSIQRGVAEHEESFT